MPPDQGNTSKHRGKYTTRACEECRRRRAKCDGKKPSCSRCLQGNIPCQYSVVEDGRRPASKTYVLSLRQRIESLERLLERHGIDPREGEQTSSRRALDSGAKAQMEDGDSVVDELAEGVKGKLALDESLNFDMDGELRYFGPTSGRLEFQGSSGALDAFGQGRVSGLDCRDSIITDLDIIGFSRPIQEHLIALYFTWKQPWFAVVDEDLYRQSMNRCGRYWSPLLHVAILAVGSRYSDRIDVRSDSNNPNTAGKMFLEQAKRHLHSEMERPSLTSIQALAIIGTFYIAMGADAAGWLYHGMAGRLCLDMGLNMDPAGFEETNMMSHREIQLRRQIYWTLYCHDKWASSYTGRICSMLDSQGAVKMPDGDDVFDTDSPGRKAFRPLQRAMISICRIQERIILSLWAPKPLLKDNQRPAFLESCLLDLRTWFYDLPTELRVDRPNDIPHAYILQMIYHTARILLSKPFIMRENPRSNKNPTGSKTTDLALSICCESARAICLVAQRYRQVFGGFHLSPISATHCTLSAALVLLDETENLNLPSQKNKLSLCLMVLDELAKSWHPARLIGHNLRKLCRSAIPDGTLSPHAPPGEDDNIHRDGSDIDFSADLDLGLELPNISFDGGIEPDQQTQLGSALASQFELSVPMDSLLIDYGFFDILNQSSWDWMW